MVSQCHVSGVEILGRAPALAPQALCSERKFFLFMLQNVKILSRAPALAPQALCFGYKIMSLLQSTHTILKFLSILGYEPSNRHWLDKSTSLKNRK